MPVGGGLKGPRPNLGRIAIESEEGRRIHIYCIFVCGVILAPVILESIICDY